MNRLVALVLLLAPCPCLAEPLPRVVDAEWPKVRERARILLPLLKKQPGTLSAETANQLDALLKDQPRDPEAALEKLQDLLDPHCLVGAHINPESRVKAARGPASAELILDRPYLILLKIHNEGGITPPLSISGDELRRGKDEAGRWLEAVKLGEPALKNLGGQKLEYVAVLLTPREAGKREATLKFDAGQGTQDLGFRAEVPILFRVKGR